METPGGLIVLLGVEIEPLSTMDVFTTSTATEALIESLPRSISHEGNLGAVTAVFGVTERMLAEMFGGTTEANDNDGRDDDDRPEDGQDPEDDSPQVVAGGGDPQP